jgi:hypothetical protein
MMRKGASMNEHWQRFIEEITWFLEPGQTAEVDISLPPGSWSPASSEFENLFPEACRILRAAIVTEVAVVDVRYQLYTWLRADRSSCSWLSPAPSPDPPRSLHPDHRVLLRSFGGIVERSNEPSWWVLNHNDVLTENIARYGGAFTRKSFEDAAIEIPADVEQLYTIANEANGNVTFCHRLSGAVVLHAHDHNFDYVETYPGYPDYTLYRLPEAPCFRDWVNTVSRQWRQWVEAVA